MSDPAHLHSSHPQIVKRLRRADGHLRSVIEMIEARRPCEDIAQQLYAVEKAIAQAKKTLIHDHLDHCLEHAVQPEHGEQQDVVASFKTITKYL